MTVIVNDAIESNSCKFTKGIPDSRPNLSILQARAQCENKIFLTVSEAENCVLQNVVASDSAGGCRPVTVTQQTTTTNNCDFDIKVTATICNGLYTESDPVKVKIDGTPPVPMCEFGIGHHIRERKGRFVNPLLSYSITDNCGALWGDLDIVVETFSNEHEELMQEQVHHFFNTNSNDKMKVGLYIAAEPCPSKDPPPARKCIADASTPDIRVYTTKVTATDAAGLVGTTTCSVNVHGKKLKDEPKEAPLASQQFLIESYSGKY
eukprot:15365719-Ditylum_brightwellii.AAC.1